MIRLVIECVVRSTLIAIATTSAIRLFRIRAAAARHAAWTVVLAAMLVLPAWMLWGPRLAVGVLPASTSRTATTSTTRVTDVAVTPAESVGPVGMAAAPSPALRSRDLPFDAARVGGVVYLAGVVMSLAWLTLGTVQTWFLVRRTLVYRGRVTSPSCVAPLTAGWLRPVTILPTAWTEWSSEQLDAVLIHESAHVRRRDPLIQWLAMLNRALFWCHPLAWWLERRLSALAEAACDAEVLAGGHDGVRYAEYLLAFARRVSDAGSRVRVGTVAMSGSGLTRRVGAILAGSTPRASRVQVAVVVIGCLSLSALGVSSTPVQAQEGVGSSSRVIVRVVRPRWQPPESPVQPMSLPWLIGDEWPFDVKYLLTDDDLAAYGALRTIAARDAFIGRFWARQDPRGSGSNPFREEYERRVRYVRQYFAVSADCGTCSLETDQGLVTIILGSPDAMERRVNSDGAVEDWHYHGTSAGDLSFQFVVPDRGPRSYTIHSTTPPTTFESASDNASERTRVEVYPFGFVHLTFPAGGRVTGIRWELHDRTSGVVAYGGEAGTLDHNLDHAPTPALALAMGRAAVRFLEALPADSYELSTTMQFANGEMRGDMLEFDVR